MCHLWNPVAEGTREGEVYYRLLLKLEAKSSTSSASWSSMVNSSQADGGSHPLWGTTRGEGKAYEMLESAFDKEKLQADRTSRASKVAPRAGAWIETNSMINVRSNSGQPGSELVKLLIQPLPKGTWTGREACPTISWLRGTVAQ